MTFMDSRCFREFKLASDINAPYSEGGLNGNAMNLMKPLGRLSMLILLLCLALFTVYQKTANKVVQTARNNGVTPRAVPEEPASPETPKTPQFSVKIPNVSRQNSKSSN